MKEWIEKLEHSYKQVCDFLEDDMSKLEYLADFIFGITTYENIVSSFLVQKCIEVCYAITDRKTFEYISTEENNLWYLVAVNLPFFEEKITWGTSIRGAFWEHEIKFETTGLFNGEKQEIDFIFKREEWEEFMKAVKEFAK